MTCNDCRTHEHSDACWDGKPLRSNLNCIAKVDLCAKHEAIVIELELWEHGFKGGEIISKQLELIQDRDALLSAVREAQRHDSHICERCRESLARLREALKGR